MGSNRYFPELHSSYHSRENHSIVRPNLPLQTTTTTAYFTRARRPPREASQIQSVAGVWWRGRREDTGYEEDESFVERGQCRNHSCEVVRLSAFFCDGGVAISHHPPLLLPSFAHVEPLRQKLYLTAYIQRICLVLRIGNARTNLLVTNSDLFG